MAKIVEKIQIYEISGAPSDKAWSWKLLGKDSQDIAKSEIGYPKDDIMGIVKTIRAEMGAADIDWSNLDDDPNKAGKDEGGEKVDIPGS